MTPDKKPPAAWTTKEPIKTAPQATEQPQVRETPPKPANAVKSKPKGVYLLLLIFFLFYLIIQSNSKSNKTDKVQDPSPVASVKEDIAPPTFDPNTPMGIAHPAFVEKETTTETDEYTKTTRFDAPYCVMLQGECVSTDTQVSYRERPKIIVKPSLVVIKTANESPNDWLYSIHLQIDYMTDDDPQLSRSAYAKNSTEEFKYKQHSFKADCHNGCSAKTYGSIHVSREFLLKSRYTGIDMKIISQSGDVTFKLPKGYVQGFMNALPD